MRATDINTKMVDSYFTMLKNLSANNKLELIARLSQSLKTPKRVKDNTWKSLFGAFIIDQPADDFVAELKRDRKFNRKSIDL